MRYLREAKAELAAAKKIPYMASSLVLEAVKKAQAAVYYSLGDPSSVEVIVHQTILKNKPLEDPALRCLVEIEHMVQQVALTPELDREKAFEQADELIHIASDIVKLFVGEMAD